MIIIVLSRRVLFFRWKKRSFFHLKKRVPQGVITSCGALAPASRLARLMAVELVVVKAMLNVPFPVISEVTSML